MRRSLFAKTGAVERQPRCDVTGHEGDPLELGHGTGIAFASFTVFTFL